MNVEQWVEMFRATGLDEAMMHRWHSEFESRYPEQHDAFLKWLNMSPEDVLSVRAKAKGN